MRDTSFGVFPIREYAFFKQADFERLIGDNLLQRRGFSAQTFYLIRGRSPCRVPSQPALARAPWYLAI
jgi:hypothetical protein